MALPEPAQARAHVSSGKVWQSTPYAHAEIFREGDNKGWTRFRYAAGAEFALTRRIVLEAYYLRQNDWRASPQFVNALGSALQVYLR